MITRLQALKDQIEKIKEDEMMVEVLEEDLENGL